MWNNKELLRLIRKFIPNEGKVVMLNHPYGRPAIEFLDIDGDGMPEIRARYKLNDSIYVLVLKSYCGNWYISGNYKIKKKLYRQSRLVNLYSAKIKTVNGDKWGFIDSTGNFKIKPVYDYAYDFQDNGLAIVSINNNYGIINSLGNYVVIPKYSSIEQFSEGRAVVGDTEGSKVIDENGRVLTAKAYSYIGKYSNGRVLFANNNAQGKYLYGYLDREGREIIPLQFESAGDFKEGKTIVKVKDNKYELIDLNGKVLNTYNYYFVGNLGDGLLPFQESSESKNGYIDESGKVVISPQYDIALPFSEGRAVVNISEDIINKYGLIDKNGNYIIKPLYNDINLLGENRVAVGRAIEEDKPYLGSKYAIADTNGKILSDFLYYNVSNYKNGLASAYDNKNTFFIDNNGKIMQNLPIVSGSGIITFENELIKAFVDNRLSYYDKNGKIVWKQNTIIPLNNIYKVVEVKYNPNKDYLVYYPQIEGMSDKKSEENVNAKLKELSQVKPIEPNVQLDYSYSGDFSISFFKKQLLVLALTGYNFPFGAAHGMPTQIYTNIDLVSGRFYELQDLFKENSNYVKVLSDIIGAQIKNNPQYSYVFPDSYKGISADQPFYVDANNLYIYFEPYDIAPYVAGFPTFIIPFREIMYMINTNGAFWKSFN